MGKLDGDLPVAIAIGCPLHVLLAASMAPPMPISSSGMMIHLKISNGRKASPRRLKLTAPTMEP